MNSQIYELYCLTYRSPGVWQSLLVLKNICGLFLHSTKYFRNNSAIGKVDVNFSNFHLKAVSFTEAVYLLPVYHNNIRGSIWKDLSWDLHLCNRTYQNTLTVARYKFNVSTVHLTHTIYLYDYVQGTHSLDMSFMWTHH